MIRKYPDVSKLSGLLVLAASCAEAWEDQGFKLDMRALLECGRNGALCADMAGATLAIAWGVSVAPGRALSTRALVKSGHGLRALAIDAMRRGDFQEAAQTLGVKGSRRALDRAGKVVAGGRSTGLGRADWLAYHKAAAVLREARL